jgi:hypothetical protein
MSGVTLTLKMHYDLESFDLTTILSKLKQDAVVVLHSDYTCPLIFHKCIGSKLNTSSEIDVFYKDVKSRERLLGKGGWENALYQSKGSECNCKIDDILRAIWSGREETRSKGFILLEKS